MERGRVVRPMDVVGFGLMALPDSLERRLATVAGELERVARDGIPTATLVQRKAVLLSHLEHAGGDRAAPAARDAASKQ